jgi:GNAT superfamily N-acetyltransferase
MTLDDLPLGMRLKDRAGWNQTEADWRRILWLQPDGCFVAEWDGRPVGTAAVVALGPVGWLQMVLVDEAFRSRGIGTRLVEHLLGQLDRLGVATARLDATPLGQLVYEKLGFVAEYALTRWEAAASGATAGSSGSAESTASPSNDPQKTNATMRNPSRAVSARSSPISPGRHAPARKEQREVGDLSLNDRGPRKLDRDGPPETSRSVRAARREDLDALCRLDAEATATPRRRLLQRLFGEQPERFLVAGGKEPLEGYAAMRLGTRAVQIGPVVARSAAAGRALLDAALGRCAGRQVFIDVPDDNADALRWTAEHGFSAQRPLVRMSRGAPPGDRPEWLWASFGPEKG